MSPIHGNICIAPNLPGIAHELTLSCYSRKNTVKMFKQSHPNIGANFISSDAEGGYSQVQGAYAQSGPPAANGTNGVADQEIEAAAPAAIPTYAVVEKSKKKKKKLREEVPPVYAEVDKSKKKKKKVDDKNLYETLDEPKKVCILLFLAYYTAFIHIYIIQMSLDKILSRAFHLSCTWLGFG